MTSQPQEQNSATIPESLTAEQEAVIDLESKQMAVNLLKNTANLLRVGLFPGDKAVYVTQCITNLENMISGHEAMEGVPNGQGSEKVTPIRRAKPKSGNKPKRKK